MLDRLIKHNDQIPLSQYVVSYGLTLRFNSKPLRREALTRFHSRTAPSISVLDYLHRVVRYTNLEVHSINVSHGNNLGSLYHDSDHVFSSHCITLTRCADDYPDSPYHLLPFIDSSLHQLVFPQRLSVMHSVPTHTTLRLAASNWPSLMFLNASSC